VRPALSDFEDFSDNVLFLREIDKCLRSARSNGLFLGCAINSDDAKTEGFGCEGRTMSEVNLGRRKFDKPY